MKARFGLVFATSGHSGVDRLIKNLLPEFGRQDAFFDLLLIHGYGPHLDFASLPSNVRAYRFPIHSKKLMLAPLAMYVLHKKPDAILTANHQLNRAGIFVRAATRRSLRVAVRMGTSLEARSLELAPAARKRLFRSMRRWYPMADTVIVPSNGVRKDMINLVGLVPEKIRVIRNPIVNPALVEASGESPSHLWFQEGEPPVILGVGSLEPLKDFSTLIKAFAIVRKNRRCRLVILGEGRQRSDLIYLAMRLGVAGDVDLPGYKPNPYAFMRRASVFVLASHREGASAVIVEALACGTPVVSTDCPSGPAEVLQQGRIGPLVKIGDEVGMAAAIINMMDEPPARDALVGAACGHEASESARQYLLALGLSNS